MGSPANKPPTKVLGQTGRKLGPRAIETRRKLLDATLQLLGERSVLDISVAEIARQVGIVPSLFYHYFKDVEEATQHIAKGAASEMPDIVSLIGGGLEGEVGLQRARDLVTAYIEHWERYRGALLFRNHAADRGDPAFQRIRRNALRPLVDALRELLEQSQKAGRIARDLHPNLAASGLVAILERLAAHADRVRFFDATKKQLVDTCARMIHTTVTGAAASPRADSPSD
jgi:AcrR family transcriptional regulator